ncbi:MAG: hypothetical protein IIX15_01995 [Clostridia bacterium]|nr:hypothetical protein [Clostridia bacterium]
MRTTLTRQALGRLGRSIAFRVLVAAILLYVIYHCIAAFSDRVVTDVIVEGEQRETVSGEAVIFRDETVYCVSGGPYLCSYPLENGAKVNAVSTLAQLYTTSGDAETVKSNQAKLLSLDRQIAVAERMPSKDMLSALAAIQADARQELLTNAQSISDGAPMSVVADASFSLLLSLNRIGALTGHIDQGSDRLVALLRTERQRLLLSAGYSARTVTVADIGKELTGGYFYYGDRVDGYEQVFRRADLDQLTLATYDALLAAPRTEYGTGTMAVGKLVSSYAWSIVVPIDPTVASRMKLGEDYSVRFTDEYELTLSMTLDDLVGTAAEGRMLAVLSCKVAPPNFDYTRFSHVEIMLDTVHGYRVPETALCQVNGQTGVYILDGGRVCWRELNVITHGEGYVLAYAPTKNERQSEQDSTYHADRYIALRDVVITEGDDLYDGKYID